nr:hypothetical protein [Rhodococcus sp. (in: high G+C Gram-positive bacteria)]
MNNQRLGFAVIGEDLVVGADVDTKSVFGASASAYVGNSHSALATAAAMCSASPIAGDALGAASAHATAAEQWPAHTAAPAARRRRAHATSVIEDRYRESSR